MLHFVQSLCCLLLTLVVCVLPSAAQAHAVRSQHIDNTVPVVLEFAYSTGDLARYTGIEVFSPSNRSLEYQNGRTDQQGRFSFTPNELGEWLIVMQDNMGHKLEVPVQIQHLTPMDKGLLATTSQPVALTAPNTTVNALLGLSLLLNILTGWYWYKKRRESRAH